MLVIDICKITEYFNCSVIIRYRDSKNLAVKLLGRRDLSIKLNYRAYYNTSAIYSLSLRFLDRSVATFYFIY